MFMQIKPIIAGILVAIALHSYLTPLHIEATWYADTTTAVYNQPTRQPSPVPTDAPRHPTRVQPVQGNTPSQTGKVTGEVSFYTNDYCRKYNPQCRTANGEVFDDTQFTAACASRYPLGSTLRVTYKDAVVLVRCNDRGAFSARYNRLLDLSKASFEALAPLSRGHITVQVELVK